MEISLDITDDVGLIHFDDGKKNAFTLDGIKNLSGAFDEAEARSIQYQRWVHFASSHQSSRSSAPPLASMVFRDAAFSASHAGLSQLACSARCPRGAVAAPQTRPPPARGPRAVLDSTAYGPQSSLENPRVPL